ncbi:hypothetical protein BC939DRAFT_491347 [Gamsiella multidivaricata]|uniref:uncharacterized protein n=1 Tax=Gamsiella multidivaricata TaxID=101098 RepID=UPI0022206763|nr:uncharacterized protein BC939DRAFT_491347 [Gamsiella multidivaricata]KAI7827442.1 hypothetical protein BC939DRAFT_491347 [Gamsiella multidivaricata]
MASQNEYDNDFAFDDDVDDVDDDYRDEGYTNERPMGEHLMFGKDGDGDDSDNSYSGLSRTRREGLQYSVHNSLAQDQLCGGSYEILDAPADVEITTQQSPEASARSEASIYATSRRGKRGLPKNPSPPLAVQQQLSLMSDQQGFIVQFHTRFTLLFPRNPVTPQVSQSLRELQACSSSASIRTSSDTAYARPNSSFTQRMLYQAPPPPSRSRVPPPSSRGLANASPFAVPDIALCTANSLEQRRRDVRNSYSAADGWYRLYESLELGTIPKPE